jgi:hypothetical protein
LLQQRSLLLLLQQVSSDRIHFSVFAPFFLSSISCTSFQRKPSHFVLGKLIGFGGFSFDLFLFSSPSWLTFVVA